MFFWSAPFPFGRVFFGSAPFPSGAPRFLRTRVLRERPVSIESPPRSPAPSVEPPALLSPVLRPSFLFHPPSPAPFGSAPFPSGACSSGAPRFLSDACSSGAPRFLRERPVSFGRVFFGSAPFPSRALPAPPLRRSSPQPFCPQCCGPASFSTLPPPLLSGAPRFLRERVLRERPVSFGRVFFGSAPFPSGAPRFLRTRVLRERPVSFGSAPFPPDSCSSGAPRFHRELPPLRRSSPQPFCPQCCPPICSGIYLHAPALPLFMSPVLQNLCLFFTLCPVGV